MGAQNSIPMRYTTISPDRDIYWMEKYGIDCHRNLHTLEWSGLDWIVKHSPMLPVQPGRNFFASLAVQNIFVMMLQLSILKKHDKWFCSEIISNKEFPFGVFQWEIVCSIQSLDPNVMFTLGLVPSDHNRGPPGTNQIGIKVSRNGRIGGPNLHFGLLPPAINNIKGVSDQRSILITTNVQYLTFRIIWAPAYVRFQFQEGTYIQHKKEALIWEPQVAPQMVPRKPLKIRMGLALLNGVMGTLNGQDSEVIVKGFSYKPLEIQIQKLLSRHQLYESTNRLVMTVIEALCSVLIILQRSYEYSCQAIPPPMFIIEIRFDL